MNDQVHMGERDSSEDTRALCNIGVGDAGLTAEMLAEFVKFVREARIILLEGKLPHLKVELGEAPLINLALNLAHGLMPGEEIRKIVKHFLNTRGVI